MYMTPGNGPVKRQIKRFVDKWFQKLNGLKADDAVREFITGYNKLLEWDMGELYVPVDYTDL